MVRAASAILIPALAKLRAMEALRPGRFALWFGFAVVLVGVIASVARWPWPTEIVALVVFAMLLIPAWRRYERKA